MKNEIYIKIGSFFKMLVSILPEGQKLAVCRKCAIF